MKRKPMHTALGLAKGIKEIEQRFGNYVIQDELMTTMAMNAIMEKAILINDVKDNGFTASHIWFLCLVRKGEKPTMNFGPKTEFGRDVMGHLASLRKVPIQDLKVVEEADRSELSVLKNLPVNPVQ